MAVALPHFAEFDVHSDGAVGIRWKKWLTRFKNLLLALDVHNTKRQRALLLHYAGESVYEIFETLPNTEAGATSFPGYLGNTLVWAGHVPRSKFSARGGVGKVSN
jgi:hypothetical protein